MNKELIPLANGEFKQRKDIVVGDYLIGQNGEATKVLFTQLVKDVPTYQVTLNDGRQFTLGKDEYLGVWVKGTSGLKKRDKSALRFLTPSELRKDSNYTYQSSGTLVRVNKYSLPINSPITTYPKQKHVISPYALGVLLAEGSLHSVKTKNELIISSGELNVVELFMESAKLEGFTRDGQYKYNFTQEKNNRASEIKQSILDMKLAHTAQWKFIPREYLVDSFENRLNLLKGLVDTDGGISYGSSRSNYHITYTTVSKKLHITFKQLVRSLGMGLTEGVNVSSVHKGYVSRVYTSEIIWASAKHIDKVKDNSLRYKSSKDSYSAIVDIRACGQEDEFLFTLEDNRKAYLGSRFCVIATR